MENKKLIRKDLVNWIYENQDYLFYRINKSDADRIINHMIDFFQENLTKGYKIEIRRFGTLYVKTLKPTVKTIPVKENRYYHPKEKKKKINIKERKTVKFIPSTILREYVNTESQHEKNED